jgi:hypothetical protein
MTNVKEVDIDTLNGKKKQEEPEATMPSPHDNSVDVEVEEAMGVIILGLLFFFMLMAFLRSQKRERKLLRELADIQAELATKKA